MITIHAGKTLSKEYISVQRFTCSYKMQIFHLFKRSKTTDKCEKLEKLPLKGRCSDPPKDEGTPISRKLFTVTTFALAGTALAVYGAKNDDDLREWAKSNVPALDGMVKIVYQEEDTHKELLLSIYKELTKGLKDVLYSIFHGIKEAGMKTNDPIVEPPKKTQVKNVFESPNSAFTTKDENAKLTVPENMKHLKELEQVLFKDVQEAMQTYSLATEAFRVSASIIENLDKMVSRHDCKLWATFKRKNEDMVALSKKFCKDLEKVRESAEYLQFQMDRTPDLSLDVKHRAENNIRYIEDTVNKAEEILIKDVTNQTISKLPHDKVRVARLYFYDQLETFFPNVWLDDEKLTLPEDNMSPFIEFIIQNIQVAEKDLSKIQTIREAEVNYTIEAATLDDLNQTKNDIIDIFVKIESEKEKRFKTEELQKALQANKAKCEKINRESLKSLTEVYSDLKSDALATREREVERRMEQQLEKKLVVLRDDHHLEVAKMVGRIQGANQAISSRGEKEKSQLVKQQFWSAAQNMLSAVNQIGTSNQLKNPKPLKNEILNVTKAAPDGDELVKSVVNTISAEVIEQGVPSEECLKKRFLKVEKEARYLAGVPTGPVTLITLALARIQSALYIDMPIPEPELRNEPINIEELNNYELLQRARYYVNQGDLEQSVRYLNLLKGPSEMVVSGWIKDVINYKETVQAAELLLAYACAFKQ